MIRQNSVLCYGKKEIIKLKTEIILSSSKIHLAMNIVSQFEQSEIERLQRADDPAFGVGDTLAVTVNVVEGKKK